MLKTLIWPFYASSSFIEVTKLFPSPWRPLLTLPQRLGNSLFCSIETTDILQSSITVNHQSSRWYSTDRSLAACSMRYRVWKSISQIQGFTKIERGIRETSMGYGIRLRALDVFRKKTLFGTATTEVREGGFSLQRIQNVGSDPSFPHLRDTCKNTWTTTDESLPLQYMDKSYVYLDEICSR